jgi:uncharacterized protein YjbI with pentapeptide repeats
MNQNHFEVLKRGVRAWNAWREAYPEVIPDLSGGLLPELLAPEINLTRTNLRRTIFYHADLARSMFIGADLTKTIFIEACLKQCFFSGTKMVQTSFNSASLQKANFMHSVFTDVDLSHTNLGGADFRMARLEKVNWEYAILHGLNLSHAYLENCLLYGIQGSEFEISGLKAKNLIVTNHADPTVVLDSFTAAAAVFACLQTKDGTGERVASERRLVMVFGNFQNERRELLNSLRREIKSRNLIPVVFHFDKPVSRTFLDVVRQIAALTRYVIVDFTPPHRIVADFQAALPYFKLPVQAIAADLPVTRRTETLRQYPWILEPYFYPVAAGEDMICANIIDPVERKAKEIFGGCNSRCGSKKGLPL